MNDIKYKKVNSTNIDYVGYDELSMILYIKFVDGETYQYFNVPIEIFNGLLSASSAGKYFHNEIKNKYSYEQI